MDSVRTYLTQILSGLDPHSVGVVCTCVLGVMILLVSLGPEAARPHLTEPDTERFFAYFLFGLVSILTYPDQPVLVAGAVVLAAVLLESLQYALPHRHAHFPDARHGAMGGFLGVVLGAIIPRLYILADGPKILTRLLQNLS